MNPTHTTLAVDWLVWYQNQYLYPKLHTSHHQNYRINATDHIRKLISVIATDVCWSIEDNLETPLTDQATVSQFRWEILTWSGTRYMADETGLQLSGLSAVQWDRS